jgi:hypothetical protein
MQLRMALSEYLFWIWHHEGSRRRGRTQMLVPLTKNSRFHKLKDHIQHHYRHENLESQLAGREYRVFPTSHWQGTPSNSSWRQLFLVRPFALFYSPTRRMRLSDDVFLVANGTGLEKKCGYGPFECTLLTLACWDAPKSRQMLGERVSRPVFEPGSSRLQSWFYRYNKLIDRVLLQHLRRGKKEKTVKITDFVCFSLHNPLRCC